MFFGLCPSRYWCLQSYLNTQIYIFHPVPSAVKVLAACHCYSWWMWLSETFASDITALVGAYWSRVLLQVFALLSSIFESSLVPKTCRGTTDWACWCMNVGGHQPWGTWQHNCCLTGASFPILNCVVFSWGELYSFFSSEVKHLNVQDNLRWQF